MSAANLACDGDPLLLPGTVSDLLGTVSPRCAVADDAGQPFDAVGGHRGDRGLAQVSVIDRDPASKHEAAVEEGGEPYSVSAGKSQHVLASVDGHAQVDCMLDQRGLVLRVEGES